MELSLSPRPTRTCTDSPAVGPVRASAITATTRTTDVVAEFPRVGVAGLQPTRAPLARCWLRRPATHRACAARAGWAQTLARGARVVAARITTAALSRACVGRLV